MRPIDNETRRTMNSRRNFVNYATMHLSNGTILNLTPSDFRISGNSFTDDLVDGDTFQVGTAIGKTATLLLDNTDGRVEIVGTSEVVYPHGKFSEYDFYMAYFELYVCLPNAYHIGTSIHDQMIPIGTFTVTTPTSHGSTIEIVGVDNMYLFDRSFDECDLDFSTNPTLKYILNKCCTDCGVAIGYTNFDNENLTINTRPEDTTYRQVVSYVAQMAGCNAKINVTGALILISYNMSALSNIDGGSFTEIGTEFLYRQSTWDGVTQGYSSIGYSTYYAPDIINRTGTYKITKIVIDDIVDPTNFNAVYQIYEYDSFDVNITSSIIRYNSRVVKTGTLSAGNNVIDYDITITSNSNSTVYLLGVSQDNTNPDASKFRYTYFLEPVSYDDGDSADGGSFEPERYIYRDWNGVNGTTIGDIQYRLQTFVCPDYIGVPGKYKFTRIRIYNIVDQTHFNPVYLIQKSIDGGTTWTDEDSGSIVAGDNTINYQFELPNNNSTRFRIMVGQDIVADPNATKFDIDFCFKADDALYLDGDSIDGGDFTTPLGYHNLTAINGTSVSTDDIKITGVLVSSDDNSVHYPNSTGWDYYAIEITENPFVAGYESTVAQTIYNKLSGLKFRPFTTSSIQDPTIEAGDPCIVYDVKGNMYDSIITNVTFTTGGMTEIGCHAESPARQGSRYSAPSAIRKVANNMTTYQSQQAHFNEIASAALGYYKTEVLDAQTGATITYLHDQPTLVSSQNVVKIANGIIAISDNYNLGPTLRTWNTGFDASTGTMLLNLIYVHGLTSDWINTGQLTVGGVNNIDGVIYVVNEKKYAGPTTWDGPDHIGSDGWWWSTKFGYTWLKPAGTYTITRIFIDNIVTPEDFTDKYVYRIQTSTNAGTSWTTIREVTLVEGDNYLNYTMHITESDDVMYRVRIGRPGTITASDTYFDYTVYSTRVNTIIDNNGIDTSNLHVTGGEIAIGKDTQSNDKFYVSSNGDVTARNINVNGGTLAGMEISNVTHGISFNGEIENINHFFKLAAWDGIICGQFDSSLGSGGAWKRLDYVQDWGLLKVDYAGHRWGGIVVTAAGSNTYSDWGNHYVRVFQNDVYSSDNGSVAWAGSDRKLKKNIEDLVLDEATTLINSVRPRKFEFKSREGKRYGFIAQELREVLDDDSGIEYSSGSETDNGICNINYNDFIAPLCMIVREQQTEIDDLKSRIEALEKIVNAK